MLRHGDSDYGWEREGTDVVYVIEELLETSSAVATDYLGLAALSQPT